MAILMVNYIVYDDDVFYFFDVVDIDHHSNWSVMVMMMKSVNEIEIDFDYCLVEIVSDDDGDFCGGDDDDDDDDDFCAISSSFSFFYVSLLMTVK